MGAAVLAGTVIKTASGTVRQKRSPDRGRCCKRGANIIEWVEILRPMEAHQAAEEIIDAMDVKFDRDWQKTNIEILAKALTAWARLAKAENP
jgi:hypothetical protein